MYLLWRVEMKSASKSHVLLNNTSANEVFIQDLVNRAEAYAHLARAKATFRAYRQDWQHFTGWCEKQGLVSLPTTATILALYLTDQACHLSVTTLQRRLSGITAVHRQTGHILDVHNPQLVNVLDGIRRAHGRPALSKRALTSDELRQAVENLPNSVQGIRDRALLLLGFAGALRRSELCNLDVAFGGTGKGWLKFTPEGIAICIRYSKENQEGVHIEEVAVPFGRCRITCPVEAIRVWIELSGISKGALFRVVLKSGRITEQRLSGDGVAQRVKAAARRVGIDPTLVAGHSLRAGFVTAASLAGRSDHDIMRHTRHKTSEMVRRYIRPVDLFRCSPAKSIHI
jgi:integrase